MVPARPRVGTIPARGSPSTFLEAISTGMETVNELVQGENDMAIDVTATIDALDADEAKAALKRILTAAVSPAFGATTKREMELMLFGELIAVGALSARPSSYEIMTRLGVAQTKARQLVLDRALRLHREEDLDADLRQAVSNARFVKDGTMFVVEMEDPLLHAHLKERLRRLGHVSDTSFNANLVRMTLDAARDLVADSIPDADREKVRKALVKAGAPDEGYRGVVGKALGRIGEKVGEAATDTAVDAAKDQVKSLVTASIPSILATLPSLFT
jgi:hypothetical protein